MNRSALIWTLLLLAGGGFLAWRAATIGAGSAYVRAVEVAPEGAPGWTRYADADPGQRAEPGVTFSLSRTVGIWTAALLSLCIFSFLYGDNPAYRFAEAIFIGTSAAYAMVVGFWTGIVDKLLANLTPALMRAWALPGLESSKETQLIYIVPLVMGILFLWRLMPQGGWISRWPLAFFIGATAAVRLIAYFESDFIAQIRSTILPLVVFAADDSFNLGATLRNITIVGGVLACLTYFFFSVEHTGAVGGVSRLGIWFLMITFGAAFGYTVMGRIALLNERLEFLFDDWLWLIDPFGRRGS